MKRGFITSHPKPSNHFHLEQIITSCWLITNNEANKCHSSYYQIKPTFMHAHDEAESVGAIKYLNEPSNGSGSICSMLQGLTYYINLSLSFLLSLSLLYC
jgi:hypothetical protein